MNNDDILVGIDLGTTNSLIGAIVEGRRTLFKDPTRAELIPSAVSVGSSGKLYVGRPAKNRRLLDPEGTVLSIKRRMGTDTRIKVGQKTLSPPQISALILGALLDCAQASLGKRPERAVITVPAYFNDVQRQATRDAGELAGLRVERLVNEPTAAALTYTTGAEELVMVYDLGGGTFDVSILERDKGLLEVRTSRGDTHLGGDDIDQALTELVLLRLGEARQRIEQDLRAKTRLIETVERAKVMLSDRMEVRLFDPFLTGTGSDGVHLDLALTRAEVEKVARPFILRTLQSIDLAMRDAGVKPLDCSRVVLVGGASKMPLVRAMVAEHLGRPVHTYLDADRAVALGAAVLAGRIGGAEIHEVLVDITPHTLSVGVADRAVLSGLSNDLLADPVIPKNTVVPVERTKTVYTLKQNQKVAEVPIVQGEHRRLSSNTQLGKVRITSLPAGPEYAPIDVTFRLDLSGVLHVFAQHLPSGKSATVEIKDSPYRLTEQRRDFERAEVKELERRGAQSSEAPHDSCLSLVEAMLARAKRAVEDEVAKNKGGPAVERVRSAANALEQAVATGDPETMQRYSELSDALFDVI